jgi:hypothetical protein
VPHGTHLPSLMLRAGECRLKATGREPPSHGVEVRHACTRCPVFSVEAVRRWCTTAGKEKGYGCGVPARGVIAGHSSDERMGRSSKGKGAVAAAK